MRIVLKPAGALLILAAFGLLVFLLLGRRGPSPATAAAAAAASPGATMAVSSVERPVAVGGVQNAGFEAGYVPVQPYDDKAVLHGEVAAPWHDDSSWAHVTVAYATDTAIAHSGNASQRIEIADVKRSGSKPNAVQFVQPLSLPPGKRYAATLWVRADRPTPVEFSLREAAWPYTYYGAKTYTVGKGWQKIRTEATVAKKGDTFVMLKVWQPAIVWVDDASVAAS